MVDIGGTMPSGYCSDCTRTYVIGAPPPDFAAYYQVLKDAQEAACAAVRPGISAEAVDAAGTRWGPEGLLVAQMNALALGFGRGSFRWACSSHLIEHFADPEGHVRELSRVLADDGTVFFLTPNAPADFENPFHIHLFEPAELGDMLGRHFHEVTVQGVDAVPHVKADFTARRQKADKVLRLDVLDLRHRIPRSWYIGIYTRVLPLAYKVIARGDSGGLTGITADDFFVTDDLDRTTMVLFATASRPRRPA